MLLLLLTRKDFQITFHNAATEGKEAEVVVVVDTYGLPNHLPQRCY
jgi:hypothetical protein